MAEIMNVSKHSIEKRRTEFELNEFKIIGRNDINKKTKKCLKRC